MDDLYAPERAEDGVMTTTAVRGGADADLAQLLDELFDVVDHAKSMPLSSSALISRDEVLEIIAQAREALPIEIQRARRLLQDRDEVRSRAELEATELLDAARAQAAHLVQRSELVRQARHEAERIIADADSQTRRIRHEADDYVDRKLAGFEIVLDRTLRTIQAGRQRLAVVPEPDEQEGDVPLGGLEAMAAGAEEGFFDQDDY